MRTIRPWYHHRFEHLASFIPQVDPEQPIAFDSAPELTPVTEPLPDIDALFAAAAHLGAPLVERVYDGMNGPITDRWLEFGGHALEAIPSTDIQQHIYNRETEQLVTSVVADDVLVCNSFRLLRSPAAALSHRFDERTALLRSEALSSSLAGLIFQPWRLSTDAQHFAIAAVHPGEASYRLLAK